MQNENGTYNEIGIQQFKKMLHNLNLILEKSAEFAVSRKIEPEVLLNSRLAPDQFPLVRQIQIACDTAKLCASRLSGKTAPVHADNEKSLGEIRQRIDSVIQYLNSFQAADFANASQIHVTQARWEGKHMLGQDYFAQHALPNFYFHMTTAYAILRHNGVPIGKKDYLGELSLKA